jgi:peptide deformylase
MPEVLPFPIILIDSHEPQVLRSRVIDSPCQVEDVQPHADRVVVTCERHAALGIAGPHVGLYLPFFYMDVTHRHNLYRCFFINPAITGQWGRRIPYKEVSISDPDHVWAVERYDQISVSFTTLDGRLKEKLMEDFPARVFQHLYDQLCGILPLDTGIPCVSR